jgi:hypothetical protein
MIRFGASKKPSMDVSFVIPCLNEERSIKQVIYRCHEVGKTNSWKYEIIIADNGSTDRSKKIAEESGCLVVDVVERGYGSAIAGGIMSSSGLYIVMGDADNTYDFMDAKRMVEQLSSGFDLVIGNRFTGGISPRAMPWSHRYIGNPILSLIGRAFFGISIRDFHCGLRAFRKDLYYKCSLSSKGMEFASEMLIKASLYNMRIGEVSVTLSAGPKGRKPHLRTWRDGWRHLRYMLSFSPRYSYLMIFVALVSVATAIMLCYLLGINPLSGPSSLVVASILVILGLSFLTDYISSKKSLDLFVNANQSSRHVISKLYRDIDRVYQLSVIIFGCFCLIVLVQMPAILAKAPSSRPDHLVAFITSILFSSSLLLYGLASKLSMLASYKSFNPDFSFHMDGRR